MVLYALMTFPSTYFDINLCVRHATKTATDRKRRVRQAALDVLAVLGQISSTKIVMDIVQQLAYGRDDGQHLCAAVKARLSRKQLPIISVDGNVQYALRIPSFDSSTSSYLFGADIEWITAGSGSVSPTSLKKRSQRVNHMTNGHFHDTDDMNRFVLLFKIICYSLSPTHYKIESIFFFHTSIAIYLCYNHSGYNIGCQY